MNTQETATSAEGRNGQDGANAGRYLTFELSAQSYGVSILTVREIIAFQETTSLAGTPSSVEGVINLRGRIIPIIDLAGLLSLQSGERTARTCIIVTEVEGEDGELALVGCIVDTVSEVMHIHAGQIEAPPQLGPSVDMSSVLGLAKIGDAGKVVSLLDIHRVLGSLSSLSFA